MLHRIDIRRKLQDMEILTSSGKKRTVLIVSDGVNDLIPLKEIIDKNYKTIYVDHPTADFQKVRNLAGNLSAAIICAPDAAANDFALFDWISQDNFVASVPLLRYCGNESDMSFVGEFF